MATVEKSGEIVDQIRNNPSVNQVNTLPDKITKNKHQRVLGLLIPGHYGSVDQQGCEIYHRCGTARYRIGGRKRLILG